MRLDPEGIKFEPSTSTAWLAFAAIAPIGIGTLLDGT